MNSRGKAMRVWGVMIGVWMLAAPVVQAKSTPHCKKGYEPCGTSCMPIGAECCGGDGAYCEIGESCAEDACVANGPASAGRADTGAAAARSASSGAIIVAANAGQGGGDCPSDMVRVPGGEFFMGCNAQADDQCSDDEKPGRRVSVAGFCIDRTEVTVANYRRCVQAGSCRTPDTDGECNWSKPGRDNHAVNCVDWQDAVTYCDWAGRRLPTEAEWEKAARGSDGRVYPWGNIFVDGKANTDRAKIGHTTPVGSYPAGASPYGALDMAGNVWEWTADWYDSKHDGRVLRGGAWFDDPRNARASYRNRSTDRGGLYGFRCAR